MSKEAMKFIGEKLASIDRRSLSALQAEVVKAVAWKTLQDRPCRCGEDVLAAQAKANKRTVRRALDKAVELGLIRRKASCRGAHGGRGRLFDTIYIIGFNDTADTSETPKSENQSDFLSGCSAPAANGHSIPTNRTFCPDQPDKKSNAYIEKQLSIKRQSTSHPYPSHASEKGRLTVRAKLTNEVESVLVAVAADRPDDEAFQIVLGDFLAPLIRQRTLTAPSLIGTVMALATWLVDQELREDELQKALGKLLENRIATVKPSDIERTVKTIVAHRPLPRKLSGDAVLMQRWPHVLAVLEAQIGAESTQQIFSTFVIESIGKRNAAGRVVAHVSTHADWARKHVELELSAQFRVALNVVFPGVSDVWIETRKATA